MRRLGRRKGRSRLKRAPWIASRIFVVVAVIVHSTAVAAAGREAQVAATSLVPEGMPLQINSLRLEERGGKWTIHGKYRIDPNAGVKIVRFIYLTFNAEWRPQQGEDWEEGATATSPEREFHRAFQYVVPAAGDHLLLTVARVVTAKGTWKLPAQPPSGLIEPTKARLAGKPVSVKAEWHAGE